MTIKLNDYIIPFGKHKGKVLDDVPGSYLLWLYDQGCSNAQINAYVEKYKTVLAQDNEED